MYAGFNLEINEQDLEALFDYAKNKEVIERELLSFCKVNLYQKHRMTIKNSLESYLQDDGALIASEIEADWFPDIKADVFLSHSHQDEMLVLGLTAWLYVHFRLVSFVDSCVWGFADDLLKEIDDKYCKSENDSHTYNYEKRNQSTSHVHMLLNTALAKMIDSTECVIFVNTPNSLDPKETIENPTTKSPWIYSELCISKIIRTQDRRTHRVRVQKGSEILNESKYLHINYSVPLNHLHELSREDLIRWDKACSSKGPEALDTLYINKGII